MTLVVVVTTCFILGLVAITVPLVYDQLITLSKLIGEITTDISSKFSLDLGGFEDTVTGILNDLIGSVGKYISTGTISFVGKSVDFLTKAIIIYIVFIYFLAGMDGIRKNVKKILKHKSTKAFNYIKSIF